MTLLVDTLPDEQVAHSVVEASRKKYGKVIEVHKTDKKKQVKQDTIASEKKVKSSTNKPSTADQLAVAKQ